MFKKLYHHQKQPKPKAILCIEKGTLSLLITLISLNGMSKLFSSLESNPKSRAASLKFLLVATKAFMVSYLELCSLGKTKNKQA